ncbi:ribonuclease R [Emcibacter sp. SYSU 3D8]|uniref:ribonuclease R n=1 Tax=Emcibacter sp. SYSU 3D8 TaxID=3133969 RepID=UPI0031FF1329
MTKDRTKSPPFPTKADIIRFVEENPGLVGKNDIARAFHVRGDNRAVLKDLLRDMALEGLLEKGHRRSLKTASALPNVTVVEITGQDVDGELLARPVKWTDKNEDPPRILVAPGKQVTGTLGPGDRVLVRLERLDDGYEAKILKKLEAASDRTLGVYRRKDARVVPTDKRERHELIVEQEDSNGAQDGELVLVEVRGSRNNRLGLKHARVIERLGDLNAPRSTSLIAIHAHGIPTEFPADTIDEANAAKPVGLEGRTDLRAVPLVTIDPADARDHDDAVWAEPDPDPKNPGGWHVIVAIADVAHYVTQGSALDREAYRRGNSVYFPDRVVPMLPHELSSDLCSLMPGVDRACLAVSMWFDASGNKLAHKFMRGLMRSAGNMSYERVQAAYDGHPDDETGPLLEPVIKPLYAAYFARVKERTARGPLDLDLPERKVELDEEGKVRRIALRERFDAHRLIEEFMIAANVAAAEELEKHRTPCMYRVHEPPGEEKLSSLREFLETLSLKLPKGQKLSPNHFNKVLQRANETAQSHIVSTVVLRSQSQAYYGPDNQGHFGLALARYAHFTSPIRRYADLLVHRGLIRALRLGHDGLREDAGSSFNETGEHISRTERRAMVAERDANDRYMAQFMSDKVGSQFRGRISGVSRFGLFIALDETGAEGLAPISTLGWEFFTHDEKTHALVGRDSGTMFRLGDPVDVRLAEAAPITGGLRFEVIYDAGPRRSRGKPRKSGGPPRRRR